MVGTTARPGYKQTLSTPVSRPESIMLQNLPIGYAWHVLLSYYTCFMLSGYALAMLTILIV